MKKLCWWLLCWPLVAHSQNINVRLFDGVDTFRNPLWNNWHPRLGAPDTTAPLVDIFSNTTTIRAVLMTSDNFYNNGTGYAASSPVLPDTMWQKGVYNTGPFPFTLIGCNDSALYTLSFYASRNRTDGQSTVFYVPGDTVRINTDTNSYRVATLPNLVSHGGQLVVGIANKGSYDYLNGFTIAGVLPHPPIYARITIDSAVLHYPHSVAKLRPDSSTGPIVARQWYQRAGPTPAIFTPSDSTGMWVSGLQPGQYVFTLVVQDRLGNLDSSSVQVTVVPLVCAACPPPVICPVCPPPVVCPVCPPPRNAIGISYTLAGGSWVLKFSYDDGKP